ncbi:xanthine dehydrogenase family protein molybdopterin-binding subunit [Sedimentitalea arenosa]|uniref:Xanthine dehydrogenase family protein molybdopterin-binding subunit n=1 Tax=Sedimentitalea arenosa TaxID=2798803 RepID=A0A8J7JBL5_9RHOB|nr:molybdopterin cofactor-binding domain-containing protein [Arenibacterium arenosum]MBJ6371759.1 xanthine dehydrogenase family protein molybdopterin-binding subunit [Arenibacterium arenosum]
MSAQSGKNGFELRKDLFADERDDNLNEIGKRIRRQDIEGHVTGRSPFYDDHLFDGLLHIRCVRSPHHHARIRRIDTSRAAGMDGVVRIVTGADVPVNLNTLLSLLDFGLDDEPVLSHAKVAYKGEPVAAVIAATEAQARAAAQAVQVDWEVLPHVLDVEEALKPGAPTVNETYPANAFVYHGKYDHQKLRYGDVDRALAEADHVVEGRYEMSPIEQAPIETCGAIAAQEQNGRYVCYTGTQALFFSLGTASKVLNLPSSRLHFIGGTVGGGFGGKVDSIHEPLAILGTMLTGRPCKSQWDREEEMQVGAPRGAERWYVTDGVMKDGRITARKFTGYFDSGAYTRLSSYAIIKGVGHLPGPYTIPNVYADVYCVYTNRTPATAMRGFGITGVDFAIEAHMDKVAERVGMNPVDLRILNAYRDGDMKAHRRVAKNCALVECCQVAAEKAGVRLSPDPLAATSMTGGGGPRGALPAHTATDENGRVEGFSSGSYAQKDGVSVQPVAASKAPAMATGQRAPGGGSTPPQGVSAPSPAPPAPVPSQPAAKKPARSGAMRFSSLSGFRRR